MSWRSLSRSESSSTSGSTSRARAACSSAAARSRLARSACSSAASSACFALRVRFCASSRRPWASSRFFSTRRRRPKAMNAIASSTIATATMTMINVVLMGLLLPPRSGAKRLLDVDDYACPEPDDPHQVAQVCRGGMQAAGADRTVGAAVDRETGAAGPAGRRMGLVAGEGEQAAAVVGAEARAGHLVRDREPTGRSPRAGPADADRNSAKDAAMSPNAKQVAGKIRLELKANAAKGKRIALGPHPADMPVRHRGGENAEPVASPADDGHRQSRAVDRPRAEDADLASVRSRPQCDAPARIDGGHDGAAAGLCGMHGASLRALDTGGRHEMHEHRGEREER